MTPEEIGFQYVIAARILRRTQEFGWRDGASLSRLWHAWNPERTQLHEHSKAFARQVRRMALQVEGAISDERFACDFLVNLEAFSRIEADLDDVDALGQIAMAYIPLRLIDYLPKAHDVTWIADRSHSEDAENDRLSPHDRLSPTEELVGNHCDIEETKAGPRVRRKVGFVTSGTILLFSCIPALIYLAIRAGETDVENVIQTALAILASTLFIVASPAHRTLFNNWEITEAVTGRMTLDEDSVLNIKTKRERHDIGAGLIANGRMSLLSSKASYASPYSSRGLDPGAMDLSTLAHAASHLLIVDQDATMVLRYDDDHEVELLIEDRVEHGSLKARLYKEARYWYVLRVPSSANRCMVS